MTFVDEDARAGFEYAERLTKATDSSEMTSIQRDYFKRQSERLSAQMRELNEMLGKAAREAREVAKPNPEWRSSL
jgi:hypothetical protein